MNRTGSLQKKLHRFDEQLASLAHYQRAVRYLLESLPNWLQSKRAVLLVTNESENRLCFEKAIGFKPLVSSAGLTPSDPLAVLLQSQPRTIFRAPNERFEQAVEKSLFLKKLTTDFQPSMVIPLPIWGRLWGALLLDPPEGIRRSTMNLNQLLCVIGEKAALVLRHSRMLYLLRRSTLEKELWLEITRNINSILDLDQLLETILDGLQQVVPYDKGAILLLDPRNKSIARVSRRGPAPLLSESDLAKKSEGLCSWVLQHSKPVVVHDVSRDRRYFPLYPDTQSEMDVPILHRDKTLGIFNLESSKKFAFGKNDRKLIQAFASQIAVAIDNAWLYSELVEKKEMEQELRLARRLQRALLPRRRPDVEGYDFAAINIPSRRVGGDLYDFIQFSQNRVGLAIGDVAGKGTPGALLMATLYSTYRSMIRLPIPLNQMIFELNNVLSDRISHHSFVTFFYGLLSVDADELLYCNAGHCHPILLHQDGSYEMLATGGTVLGFVHDAPYELGRAYLQPGDLLFLYTDGITEAMDPDEEFYGEQRLLDALREWRDLPTQSILRRIFRTIKTFSKSSRLQDDFTAMAVSVHVKHDNTSY